jgi:hypothetical protein
MFHFFRNHPIPPRHGGKPRSPPGKKEMFSLIFSIVFAYGWYGPESMHSPTIYQFVYPAVGWYIPYLEGFNPVLMKSVLKPNFCWCEPSCFSKRKIHHFWTFRSVNMILNCCSKPLFLRSKSRCLIAQIPHLRVFCWWNHHFILVQFQFHCFNHC